MLAILLGVLSTAIDQFTACFGSFIDQITC
jgi:hypothetical protein